MAVIEDDELSEIAAEFGPSLDEDRAYILHHGVSTRQGLGNTKPVQTRIGPFGCRIIYVGNMTVREKVEADQISTTGDYILSLEAGLVLYTSDVIQIWGRTWEPGLRVIRGQKVVPTDQRNQLFMVTNDGVLGATEPVWPNAVPEFVTLVDGEVTLRNTGAAQEYQIIQLAGPSTYGGKFATKAACDLRQKVLSP